MQFRVQGKKIQCIRAVYDPQAKRSRQTMIASFDRWSDRIPADGTAGLTDLERSELQAWLDARAEKSRAETAKIDAMYSADYINRVTRTVETSADILSADQAERLWVSIDKLQKALKKAGHPKPRKPAKPVSKALPGQADLLSE